jgi:hypothetical protein
MVRQDSMRVLVCKGLERKYWARRALPEAMPGQALL